jgi:hypothetical protein
VGKPGQQEACTATHKPTSDSLRPPACLPAPALPAGPYGTWKGGREKAPAAFCRKALTAEGEVEMWGDGKQTRSFTFIDDCVEGILRITKSDFRQPLNLGSCEMVGGWQGVGGWVGGWVGGRMHAPMQGAGWLLWPACSLLNAPRLPARPPACLPVCR